MSKRSILRTWDLAALAGLIGLVLVLGAEWSNLPATIPTHFDASGHPNDWSSKATLPWMTLGAPAFVWAVFLGIAALTPSSEGVTEDERRAAAAAPLRGLLALAVCLLMAAFVRAPLHGFATFRIALPVAGVLALIGLAASLREFQSVATSATREHWRGGVFYVNPGDPRLWVPKRVGLGMTLNFARPASWFVMALILLPVILVPVLISVLAR